MSKKISNVALLTFEGAAFNVTFLALLLILVYPLTMSGVQQTFMQVFLNYTVEMSFSFQRYGV
jgi:Na+-transporting methylmalonyl-CoA/oxaloacetate decarboxylase gamma subunit